MLLVDVLIRYSTVTLFLLLVTLAIRDGRHVQQARLVIYLGISLSCMLLTTAPPELAIPNPIFTVLRLIAIPNLALLWWLGLSLFDDDFRLGRLEWGGLALFSALVLPAILEEFGILAYYPPILHISIQAVSVTMLCHLIWTALSGRNDDLVESRRKARLWFALGLAAAALATATAEIITLGNNPPWLSLMRAAVALPLVLWGLLWFTRFDAEAMRFRSVSKPQLITPSIDPRDAVSHSRLVSAMEEDHLYTEHGLTISKLSDKIAVPEHQLRALINNGLGYRNFAAFLNNYRLAYAKGVLSDPEQARLPVLTIAMDAGYASLATFNRAFKSTEGKTPTDFRRAALAAPAQS